MEIQVTHSEQHVGGPRDALLCISEAIFMSVQVWPHSKDILTACGDRKGMQCAFAMATDHRTHKHHQRHTHLTEYPHQWHTVSALLRHTAFVEVVCL